ncbi:MAG: UDP-3-O-(3-hydroxymyristoyl)glucosamine N-acyltransferase [Bacteroidota bacterium]
MNISEITALLSGERRGDTAVDFTGAEQITKASQHHITFIGSRQYLKAWPNSQAGAAIISRSLAEGADPGTGRAFVVVDNADLAMAQLLEIFAPSLPVLAAEIHPTAIIDPTAELGPGVRIGAYCFVGKNVKLAAGVQLYHHVSVYDDSTIGPQTVIWSGTVIRERSQIGAQCILHANVSIGADGFGFRPAPDGRGVIKVPQIGNVVIGNGVEIGANSCVDRGKFSSTVVGDGCKIDNLVQIAHNVQLGRVCLIAANVGIAGSATLGDGVMVGGGASIKDHTNIGSGAVIAACAGVIADVPAGQRVLGAPAGEYRETLKEWVTLRKMAKRYEG